MTSSKKDKTRLVHDGRTGATHHGAVNPPVYHASTFLYDSYLQVIGKEPGPEFFYGRHATPTSDALEQAVCNLEGGFRTVLTPSGLNACALSLLAFVETGDHVLLTDSAYQPSRDFCDTTLQRLGIDVTCFDPGSGAEIERLITPKTKVIFLEAPGSQTMEIADMEQIVAVARAHDITTVIDNTWATPLFFKPLSIGIDVSIQAATKYFVGHADALIGTITCNEKTYPQLRRLHRSFGICAGPDDVRMALRGLRTLEVRLAQHMHSAIEIAQWLEQQEVVQEVLHPALPSHPQHGLWQKLFTGSTGLFSFTIPPHSDEALAAMLDNMEYFGMGFSWGGFESLIMPYPHIVRETKPFPEDRLLIRLHIGLEDVSDLKHDLAQGFERLKTA
ncbi:MAG: cystathionine beta-lyase [Parvibaculales bacterium]